VVALFVFGLVVEMEAVAGRLEGVVGQLEVA
jgi:hypothetical protein